MIRTKYHMKLIITPQRKAANERNSKIASDARSKKQTELYALSPCFCKLCHSILPQSKKHNTFCSKSCATKFNNTGREKVQPYKCAFNLCNNLIKKGKYCCTKCSGAASIVIRTPEEMAELKTAKRIKSKEANANYRAKLNSQTPHNVDRLAIKEFYTNCPVGHEVDHIIPISKGGLHTLENLQYLTISDNRKKSNKL